MSKKQKATQWKEGGKDTISCEKNEGAVLSILHVEESQSKGFIPHVTNIGAYGNVGNLFPAAWPDGYQKAVAAGKAVVANYVKGIEDARKAEEEAQKAAEAATKAMNLALAQG